MKGAGADREPWVGRRYGTAMERQTGADRSDVAACQTSGTAGRQRTYCLQSPRDFDDDDDDDICNAIQAV